MARRKKEEAAAPLKWENVPEIPKEEQPYPLPEGWKWVRLGDVYQINPKVVADDNVLASFVPMDKISPDMSGSFTYDIHEWGKIKKGHTQFADGDVAFAKISPCFENGKKMLVRGLKNGIGAGTTELIILRSKNILQKFTIYLLSSDEFINKGVKTYSGTVGQQRINMGWVRSYPIPLPPVKIQERIVTCIESLFSKLDEAAEKIQAVIDSHEARKQAILHQAFSGELTRNIEIKDEGPLKDIPEIPKDEQPYSLPKGWKWVKGKRIFSSGGTALPSGNFFEYIDIDSIDNIRQLVKVPKRIAVKDAPSRARRKLSEGDTLFSLVRPYLRNIAYIDKNLSKCIASTGFYVCHPSKYVDSRYLFYLMVSDYVVNGLNEYMRGDNSPAIKAKNIEEFLYPIPSIEIQNSIVNVLEPIFSKLDTFRTLASMALKKISHLKKVILTQFYLGKI